MHIEAYHNQINNRKKRRKTAHSKTSEKPTRTTGKIRGNSVILFKERRRKHSHIINTKGLTRKFDNQNADQSKTNRKRTNNKHVSH